MASRDNSQEQTKALEPLRSIVYGDAVRNKYGAFQCFCAAASDENQTENVVNYLRKNIAFHHFNRFSYSYRISTENDKPIERFKNDSRLEGCGEKILHLLQKFNVENVLLIVGVERKDFFGLLSPEYYHSIIERAKALLGSLYEKIIENEYTTAQPEQEEIPLTETSDKSPKKLKLSPSVTHLNSDMIPQQRETVRKIERPAHFMGAERKSNSQSRKSLLPQIKDKKKLLQSVLRNNYKRNLKKIKFILDNWNENDYEHLKFICMYDKMPRVAKVFKMLMILDDIKSYGQIEQNYDFGERLPALANIVLSREKCKQVSNMLREDKLLTPTSLSDGYPVVASLLEYISLLVKNFDLTEKIFEIDIKESQIEERMSHDIRHSQGDSTVQGQKRSFVLDLTKDLEVALNDKRRSTTDNNNVIIEQKIIGTQSQKILLPRVSSHASIQTKILEREKSSLFPSQRSTPRKNSVFLAQGVRLQIGPLKLHSEHPTEDHVINPVNPTQYHSEQKPRRESTNNTQIRLTKLLRKNIPNYQLEQSVPKKSSSKSRVTAIRARENSLAMQHLNSKEEGFEQKWFVSSSQTSEGLALGTSSHDTEMIQTDQIIRNYYSKN